MLGWLAILAAAALAAAVFGGISQGIALIVRREATMIALANFVSMPLFFLSSILLAQRQMPDWIRTLAEFNPVNWGVIAAREAVLPGTDWTRLGVHLALLLGVAAATAAFATWAFRSYQRSL